MSGTAEASIPGHFVPTQISDVIIQDGKQVPVTWDKQAFIPDRLPPSLNPRDLKADFYQPIVNAERALSELNGAARRLENPHILIGPFLRREAILSSKIENTIATPDEIALFEASDNLDGRQGEIEEVVNYVRALEAGLSNQRPLATNLIKQLHKVLLSGVRGQKKKPGEFRTTQNYIGSKFGDSISARYVPPPANYIDDLFKNFDEFLHAKTEIPRLIRLAMTHYQFEAIHPFNDGNGRVGRLIITLQLCRDAQLTQPLVYVSGYFERNRQQYNDLLLEVTKKGDWYNWIGFFLDALITQATDALRLVEKLVDLQQEYIKRTRRPRASINLRILIDALFASPWLTVGQVVKITGVTVAAATNLIRNLEEVGILHEATGKKRDRIWIASEIQQIISEDFQD